MGERLLAGAPLADLGAVLVIGLPLQALVGFLAGRLTAQLEEAGERLGRRLRDAVLHARRVRSARWRISASIRPCVAWCGAPIPARGPPSVLVSA